MKKTRKYGAVVATCLVASASALHHTAQAHTVNADGTIDLKINYRFPPSLDDTTRLERELRRAQLTLCDATDGQLKLNNVQVTTGDSGQADADIWLLPQEARSFNSLQINLYPGGVDGQVIAHELGHRILLLGESYEEQERWGTACGIGPSFEADALDFENNSIMQGASGFVCVDSVNNRRHSFYNPLWADIPCSSAGDCVNVCSHPSCPIDPATGTSATFFCPLTPPLNSELSVSINHDLLLGGGVTTCPSPKPASRLVLSADFIPNPVPLGVPFDSSSFVAAAATSHFSGAFRLLDSFGRVDPAKPGGGQSVHMVFMYLRHISGGIWDLHVLGRAEEYGGVVGEPQQIRTVRLFFSGNVVQSIDGAMQDNFSMVMGGTISGEGQTPDFVPGEDGLAAPPLFIDVQLAGLRTQPVPHQITALGDYVFNWKPDTGVFAGRPGLPNEMQVGSCLNDDHCRRGWNPTTQRFETADHTFLSREADQATRTGLSDWEHAEQALDGTFDVRIPPILPQSPTLGFAECGGAISVAPIPPVDKVMLVMDRSGSMEELVGKPDTGSQTRLEFAQAAARAFVDLQADQGVEVGIVSYSDGAIVDQGLQTIDDTTMPPSLPGSVDSQVFIDAINGFVAGGATATGQALSLAGEQLGAPTTGNRAIVLLSDGQANRAPGCPLFSLFGQGRSCVRDDLDERTQNLQDQQIAVYTVASGGAADFAELGGVANATGGHLLAAPDGDDLPMVYAELFARIRGESLALERSESRIQGYRYCGVGEFPCGVDPMTTSPEGRCVCGESLPSRLFPETQSFTIPVAAGAGRLNVVASSRDSVAADWRPRLTLQNPLGNPVTADSIHTDEYYKIHSVNAPMGGDWTVTLAASRDHIERSYLLAHVEDPRPDCFAKTRSFVVKEGEDAEITASAHYDVTLGAGVSMGGEVKLPNGDSLPLNFEHNIDPNIGYTATIPSAELESKGGRGAYNVIVTCEVTDDVQPQIGESIFAQKVHPSVEDALVPEAPLVAVEGFQRTIRTGFFYDTPTMPPVRPGVLDSDGDGILDVNEPPGDLDGDGIDDLWDTDADDDDIPDRDDPEIAPPCSVLDGAPSVDTCIPGPQVVDLQIRPGCVGEITSFNGTSLSASVSLDSTTEVVPGIYTVNWESHSQTFEVVLADDSPACCRAGQTLIEGTAAADSITPVTPINYCAIGYENADFLHTPGGDDSLFGSDGADYLNASGGSDLIIGGTGADYIYGTGALNAYGGSGADAMHAVFATSSVMYGGTGQDQLVGGPGADSLYPGPGASFVSGGSGNDTVVLLDECEAEAGTFLSGDLGHDTLITPLSLAELAARGVVVVSFENVVIDETRSYLSECFQ